MAAKHLSLNANLPILLFLLDSFPMHLKNKTLECQSLSLNPAKDLNWNRMYSGRIKLVVPPLVSSLVSLEANNVKAPN